MNMLPRLEGRLQRLLHTAAASNRLLPTCLLLALAGTLSAAYPITSVVVPAALLAPRRWSGIAVVTALGSAIGATTLLLFFHHLGWAQLYQRYPELAAHAGWGRMMDWSRDYGSLVLFAVAALPLPQTPALAVFAITRPAYPYAFLALLAGKLCKYLLFAWLAAHAPQHLGRGLGSLLRHWRQRRR